MPIQIVLKENPSTDDMKVVYKGLIAFNTDRYAAPENKPFLALLHDTETGEAVGGAHGLLSYGWLYITMVFVPEALRNKGFGTLLINEAETFARKEACTGIWLDTFTFQAPGFYQKAGYEQFGELPDFPPGHSRIFYRKILR